MPEFSQVATIPAPTAEVYTVVADVERYPEFVPGVLRVVRNGDLVEMTVLAGPLELAWVHRVTFVPDKEIAMTLVRGPFKRLDGRWRFEPNGDSTLVTYHTAWELDLHLPGAGFIVSRALNANVHQTMQAFRRRIAGQQNV